MNKISDAQLEQLAGLLLLLVADPRLVPADVAEVRDVQLLVVDLVTGDYS